METGGRREEGGRDSTQGGGVGEGGVGTQQGTMPAHEAEGTTGGGVENRDPGAGAAPGRSQVIFVIKSYQRILKKNNTDGY